MENEKFEYRSIKVEITPYLLADLEAMGINAPEEIKKSIDAYLSSIESEEIVDK